MALVMSGRNYTAERGNVTVFGFVGDQSFGGETLMVDLQPMMSHVVAQAIEMGDEIKSLKIKISPQLATTMIVSGQLTYQQHFTSAFEGDDYIEIKNYFDVDTYSVSLWIVRDMISDVELWNGHRPMVDNIPFSGLF
ncbi:MAG: hypothetical protein L0H38_02610 [bacterium]|nr:hypothetical protein [bacterium]